MLELSGPSLKEWMRLSYGGDTINTAVYLARLGASPFYVSALGADLYSDTLLQELPKEGVRTDYILQHPCRLPGLYAIQTDDVGERHFHYWRGESAVRAFFDLQDAERALAFAEDADWLYLSGITLSLFDGPGRARLGEVAARVRRRGGQVAFDPNYRPRGWPDAETAREAVELFARHVTLAMPTSEDENELFGKQPDAAHAARWIKWGASQVAIKRGRDGACLFGEFGGLSGHAVPVVSAVDAVDTTGAGDSFNSAFMGAIIAGSGYERAAIAGNALAGTVIQYPGAVIPAEYMPNSVLAFH